MHDKYGWHASWRVQAIDQVGVKLLMSARGRRDAMLQLTQLIATMTGAPLLDHSNKVTK